MSHSSMTPKQASLYKHKLAVQSGQPFVVDQSGSIPSEKLASMADDFLGERFVLGSYPDADPVYLRFKAPKKRSYPMPGRGGNR